MGHSPLSPIRPLPTTPPHPPPTHPVPPTPPQVTDCQQSIYTSATTLAYDYAARMGAHIVSASYGSSDYVMGWSPLSEAPPWEASWIAADLQVGDRECHRGTSSH